MSSRNNQTTRRMRAELEALRLPDLQARFREVVGETSRSPNRTFLIRRIEEALAAGAAEPASPAASAEVEDAGVDEGSPAPIEAEDTGDDEASPEFASADEATRDEPLSASADASADAEGPSNEPEGDDAPPEDPERDPPASNAAPVALDTEAASASTSATLAAPARRERGRFGSMGIAELQAHYLVAVGRETGSDDRRYLIWKIREAEKGRIPVGPRRTRARGAEPAEMKILPLRLEADVVECMDAAWRSRGIKNRMEFFRGALGHYLAHLGAEEAAALFARSSESGA